MTIPSPTKKQLREFGFLIAVGFPLLLGWLIPTLRGESFHLWTLWIAIPSLILSLGSPYTLSIPYRAWMKLGHALGWVNGHIILGAVFVIVLQPIAAAMRLTGYDPLRRRSKSTRSYRELVTRSPTDLTRPF
tara:strand:- start:232 stop:627 length:396 start_codon:yes stop_codon:yes gene_type:complete